MNDHLIKFFLDAELRGKSNAAVVSEVQDFLSQENHPAWVESLAFLDASEALEAHRIVRKFLFQSGILPDSPAFREHLRQEILKYATEIAIMDDDYKVMELTSKIWIVLRLLPNACLTDANIPVVEYPYPPSDIQTPLQLAEYIKSRILSLIP